MGRDGEHVAGKTLGILGRPFDDELLDGRSAKCKTKQRIYVILLDTPRLERSREDRSCCGSSLRSPCNGVGRSRDCSMNPMSDVRYSP